MYVISDYILGIETILIRRELMSRDSWANNKVVLLFGDYVVDVGIKVSVAQAFIRALYIRLLSRMVLARTVDYPLMFLRLSAA